MRRFVIPAAAVIGASIAIAIPVAGAATKTHITRTLIGAQAISGKENVYDVRGPGGYRGAAVQIFKLNKSGFGGTDRVTLYDSKGTFVSTDLFTISKPNAKGIVTIKGTGHGVKGTGIYRGAKENYRFTGTLNTKTFQLRFRLTGTITL